MENILAERIVKLFQFKNVAVKFTSKKQTTVPIIAVTKSIIEPNFI